MIPQGGSTAANADKHGIMVTGADSAIILVALDTNYQLESRVFTETDRLKKLEPYPHPHEKVSARLDAAAAKGYDRIKADHQADYKTYFGRMELDLGGTYDENQTTDDLLGKYKNNTYNKYLEELFFQYGRYLLIASSRKGALPAHLQGAWTAYRSSPWTAGYWHNINVQMNYWPVFTANLAEMFESYEDYNKAYMPLAKENANKFLKVWGSLKGTDVQGDNGWGIATGGYPYMVEGTPTGTSHSGPGTVALTSMLFYDQYDFTRDEAKLQNDYDVVSGASNLLSKAAVYKNGTYLIDHSASPENRNKYMTQGVAFDQQMTYETHKQTTILGKILKEKNGTVNDALQAAIDEQIDKLGPVTVGKSGQVTEYPDETYYNTFTNSPKSAEAGHRHISQLKGLYPGTSINANTPAWLDAAKVTLEKRGTPTNLPAWAFAHRMNLWARAKDGAKSYDAFQKLIKNMLNPNLWTMHPPQTFQIDGNFGGIAGIAEMLMQSHEGYIDILPAIPSVWATGSVDGLVARGNFEVGIDWSDSHADKITIHSRAGEECSVSYYNIGNAKIVDSKGQKVAVTKNGKDKISFATAKDEVYTITDIPAYAKIKAPSGLSIQYQDDTNVTATWNGVSGAAQYRVYRAIESSPDYELLGTSETTSLDFTVKEENTQKQTTYRVTAIDATGRESTGATQLLLKSNVWEPKGTVIEEEDYTKLKLNQTQLEENGWEEVVGTGNNFENPENGEFAAENGALTATKTKTSTVTGVKDGSTVYGPMKTFSYTQGNYGGNDRVTLRQYNFKGKYAVDMRVANTPANTSSWVDLVGGKANGSLEQVVGRMQMTGGSSDTAGLYNNNLNSTTRPMLMWNGIKEYSDIRFVTDSATSTFQVFRNDFETPVKTTAALKAGASGDTFNMTSWNVSDPGAYLTGVRFVANNNMTNGNTYVSLKLLRLQEIERMADPAVDENAERLSIYDLTSTPEQVTQKLTLPSSLTEGAEVTWSSSNTAIIANDGTVTRGDEDTDVIVTAKITNKTDKFTVYKDFRLTVPGKDTQLKETYTVTFDSNGGSAVEPVKVISGGKVYEPGNPERAGYQFMGWYSDSKLTSKWDFDTAVTGSMVLYAKWEGSIITVAFESNGGGTVENITLRAGEKISKLPEMARAGFRFEGWYQDQALTTPWNIDDAVKENITLYAKWSWSQDGMLLKESYENKPDQAALEQMGWSEMTGTNESPDYGKFTAESGQLVATKTLAASSNNGGQTVYGPVKTFEKIQENYDGDNRTTVRQYHFLGKYALEIDALFSPGSGSAAWIDVIGHGNRVDGGSIQDGIARLRVANTAISRYYRGAGGSGGYDDFWKYAGDAMKIKWVFDSETATYQIYKDGSMIPTVGSGGKDTFNMTAWADNKPGAYINGFRVLANRNMIQNTDYFKLNSISFQEIEASAVPAVDAAVKALTMERLTDTPANVTGALKSLPDKVTDGAAIEWISSNPDIISNDGQTVNVPKTAQDVIMTAKIVNTEDQFTVYKDFRLTVGESGEMEITNVTIAGLKITAAIVNPQSGTVTAAAVYAADGALKAVKTANTAESVSFTFDNLQSGDTVKIMIWDALKTMEPKADSVKKTV